MSKKKINFMGLLANVDSSILNIKLNHGFKIQAIPEKEGADLISILESLPKMAVVQKLFFDLSCLSENNLYYISNSFETDDDDLNVVEFDNKLIRGYLEPLIRLMRLYKEGNICMPIIYNYLIDDNILQFVMRRGPTLYVSPNPKYTLETIEVNNLHRFIQETKLPFIEPSLHLAFENFELSYNTKSVNLSFLSLMISLEALFHPRDSGELSYRISRNAAVLLGNEEEDSENIYHKIKDELYKKRSGLVHSGKSNINTDDVLKLRSYVRESIKKIYNIGKPKDDILKILNSSSFYQKQNDIKT